MLLLKRLFRILCFFATLVSSGTAFGQYRTSRVTYPSDVKQTIVREYDNPATVAYVETGEKRFFVYADGVSNTVNVQISNNYEIHDLEVFGEYVYFCGRDNSSGRGLFGWYNVPDLFFNSQSYYVYSVFPTYSGYVENFTRLAVYDRPAFPKIAIVGSTDAGLGCTMELSGVAGNANGWSYTIGELQDPRETILDVCVTDDYVVTAGLFARFGQAANFRVHDKNGMFSYTNQNWRHPYTTYCNPSCAWNTTEEVCLTAMYDNYVGVTSLAEYCPNMGSGQNNYKNGVMVSVFDMDLAVLNGFSSSVYSVFLNTFLNSITNQTLQHTLIVNGLVYSTIASRFALLAYFSTLNNGFVSSVTEFTVPSISPVVSHLLDYTYQTSIDNYNNGNGYITLGFSPNNTTDVFYHSLNYGGTECSITEHYYIIDDYIFREKAEEEAFETVNGDFRCEEIIPLETLILEDMEVCNQKSREQ